MAKWAGRSSTEALSRVPWDAFDDCASSMDSPSVSAPSNEPTPTRWCVPRAVLASSPQQIRDRRWNDETQLHHHADIVANRAMIDDEPLLQRVPMDVLQAEVPSRRSNADQKPAIATAAMLAAPSRSVSIHP